MDGGVVVFALNKGKAVLVVVLVPLAPGDLVRACLHVHTSHRLLLLRGAAACSRGGIAVDTSCSCRDVAADAASCCGGGIAAAAARSRCGVAAAAACSCCGAVP